MINETSIYEDLSKQRRKMQEEGTLPKWFTTIGWQVFQQKYLFEAETYKEQLNRIVKTLSKHTDNPKKWEKKFFDVVWNGWLSLSTPVMCNTGTNRGLSVSCSGNVTADSVAGFYDSAKETAMLSKYGFGTSSYIGGIRSRGTPFGLDGKADGVVPVVEMLTRTIRQIRQTSRRGAGAWSLDIEHDDFWELSDYIVNHPDDLNIGWIVKDSFIKRCENGDKDAIDRFSRALKVKLITGKGYFTFIDKANRNTTEAIKQMGISIKASNLCQEVFLPSDDEYTFSCVLSSMNAAKYDEWKDTDAVFTSTVFLDCVAQDLIEKGADMEGLEKVVKFTKDYRALGLGCMGFHTYLQQHSIPFESIEAQFLNVEIFKHLKEKSYEASQWMAREWGEPKACEGLDMRNATTMAVAPNFSSAIVCGSVSEGIQPFPKNVYTQGSAAGDMKRINPALLPILKEKDKYTDKVINSILEQKGSVQHLDFLSDHEKLVFKTAFEIDQKVIIRYASQRQRYIDQGQSLNLFFSADEDEEYIAEVHREAFLDEGIKALYYLRSEAGVLASKGEDCFNCAG